MEAQWAEKYQRARRVRETPVSPPTEQEMQSVWFEQWYQPVLQTDSGQTITMVQPGLWNHGAGPDFLQAAYQREGDLVVGPVELHLRAVDWEMHGHHLDTAYDQTILHVVWERNTKEFFPATRHFRRVPQVWLKEQLIAPWELLQTLLPDYTQQALPSAKPGLCQLELAKVDEPRVLEILRAAGSYRLQQKAERWRWRQRVVGRTQALWECLAEGLGYHRNQIPFRLIAQRLPLGVLKAMTPEKRAALIFGLSGLLPQRELTGLSTQARLWVQSHWQQWWKARDTYAHAVLNKTNWQLAGVRPLNRPERRLAALTQLVTRMGRIEKAVNAGDVTRFAALLQDLVDPFWSYHSTWRSGSARSATRLLGAERIQDLVVNGLAVFAEPSQGQWSHLRLRPNQATEIARQRVLAGRSLGSARWEALVQQGLLQLYRDFCLADFSQCKLCPFPELVRQWD